MFKIVRTPKTGNYAQIDNVVLDEPLLSLNARLVLTKVLNLPPNWDFSVAGLAVVLSVGQDTIRSAIRELKEVGYAFVGKHHNERGHIITDYYFYEDPAENPHTVEPHTGEPHTELPYAENPQQIIKDIKNTDITNTYLNKNLSNQSSADRIDEIDFQQKCDLAVKGHLFSIEERKKTEAKVRENICADDFDDGRVENFVKIMVSKICSTAATITIGGEELPQAAVAERLLSLTAKHIEYVLESLDRAAPDMRNPAAYTLTALYNAPETIDSYYRAQVRRF